MADQEYIDYINSSITADDIYGDDDYTLTCEVCSCEHPEDSQQWAVVGEVAICKTCQEKLKKDCRGN